MTRSTHAPSHLRSPYPHPSFLCPLALFPLSGWMLSRGVAVDWKDKGRMRRWGNEEYGENGYEGMTIRGSPDMSEWVSEWLIEWVSEWVDQLIIFIIFRLHFCSFLFSLPDHSLSLLISGKISEILPMCSSTPSTSPLFWLFCGVVRHLVSLCCCVFGVEVWTELIHRSVNQRINQSINASILQSVSESCNPIISSSKVCLVALPLAIRRDLGFKRSWGIGIVGIWCYGNMRQRPWVKPRSWPSLSLRLRLEGECRWLEWRLEFSESMNGRNMGNPISEHAHLASSATWIA